MKTRKSKEADFMSELDKIEKHAYRLFTELLDCKELSFYKSNMFGMKLSILNSKLNEYIQQINGDLEAKRTRNIKIMNATYIVTMLSFWLIWVSPYIPAFVNIIATLIRVYLRDEKRESSQTDSLNNQFKELKITLDNCDTFLKSKTKKREERIEQEKIQNNDKIFAESIANDIIGRYLDGEELGCIAPNIKETLLRMLQLDLGIEEDNLEELLKIAKEKITTQNIEAELKLTRKTAKNDEN